MFFGWNNNQSFPGQLQFWVFIEVWFQFWRLFIKDYNIYNIFLLHILGLKKQFYIQKGLQDYSLAWKRMSLRWIWIMLNSNKVH